jgi:hypothetical protein
MSATENRGALRWALGGFATSLFLTLVSVVRVELDRSALVRREHELVADLAACPARETVLRLEARQREIKLRVAVIEELTRSQRRDDESSAFDVLTSLSAVGLRDLRASADSGRLVVTTRVAVGQELPPEVQHWVWRSVAGQPELRRLVLSYTQGEAPP